MKRNPKSETNALPGVADALHRAAYRARAIAASTRTPLVFSKNGHIEKLWLEREATAGRREDFDHYLKAVPDTVPPEEDRLN